MLTPQPSPTPTSLLALAASLAADDGAGSGGPQPAPLAASLAALQLSALVHTPVAVALPADALRELTERAGASGAAEAGAAEAGAAEALLLRAVCVAHNKWATAEQLTQATPPPARPPARRCF